ncbi:hypothetical protein [Pontibacter mucosus]|nr:hypothetical protein [Pontibacter mucosus]
MKSHTLYFGYTFILFYTAVPDILVWNQFCCGLPSPRKPYFYTCQAILS